MHIIRAAIQERQSLLPFWYTLFYQYSEFGAPVIHPVVTEFPKETATFDIDYEFLLGDEFDLFSKTNNCLIYLFPTVHVVPTVHDETTSQNYNF